MECRLCEGQRMWSCGLRAPALGSPAARRGACLHREGDNPCLVDCCEEFRFSETPARHMCIMDAEPAGEAGLRILLEAQDMAVRDHNVEFRSNLYIAESTSGRGQYLKRIRYHGRGRFGIMEKVYCHYFVKLVEGPPPPPEARKTAVTHAKEYIQELRNRTIIHTL
ncbi:large ribosomal subunit protein uL22m isoform X6 [Vulpes vulpes]|uniref:Large ribosomal subunit protein uL22m n=1 Tax=Vulpes vulpes TaxID=9627 RepID=A0ABM5ADK6_VULVU